MIDEANDSDPIWGEEFRDTYIEVGDNWSIDNDTLHLGFMLALVGQATGDARFPNGDNRKHVRIHPFMVQDSGSGKDPAFDYAKNIAELAGISFSDANDISNAGLVGTYDSDGERQPGAAEIHDIIGFREAVQLIKSGTTNWSENLAENVNAIMDGSRVERHMAAGTIEYVPSCTLVGTTYPPQHVDINLESLMRNGTLARFFYLFRDITPEFRYRIGDEILRRAVEGSSQFSELGPMVATLEKIQSEFGGDTLFSFSFDYDSVRVDVREVIKGNIAEYSVATRDIVEPSVVRYFEHTLRIGCLMAALDRCSTDVTDEHIAQALEIVERSWVQMLEFFEEYHGEEDSGSTLGSREKILLYLAEAGEMSKSELAEKMDMSDRQIQRKVNDLEDLGIVEKDTADRQRVYRFRGGH